MTITMRRPFVTMMGADPSDDNIHAFETSWLLSPFALFCVRALFSLFVFTSIFTILGWNGTHGADADNRLHFSFFTNLTFWGVGFYFLFAALHTFLYERTGRSVLLDKWPRVMRVFHSLYYSTIITYPFIVTIIYWAILYDGTWFPFVIDAWRNIATHILPAVFAFFEIVFTSTFPPPFLHIPFLIIILALYLCVAYITLASQDVYVYAFLNPGVDGEKSGHVAGYCIGILAACVVIFLVSWSLIWLRRWLTPGKSKLVPLPHGSWSSQTDMEIGMGIPVRK